MKPILSGLAILAIGGAAFLSTSIKGKLDAVEDARTEAVSANKKVLVSIGATEKEIKDKLAEINAAKEKLALATASVDAAKAAEKGFKNDAAKLDKELAGQAEEKALVDRAVEAANLALTGIGGGVTAENLPQKLQEIEDKKITSQKKLDELTTLTMGAQKTVLSNASELERVQKRISDRNSRIAKNSLQAVVTAVGQDWGFVVIGAGSNSGFSPQTALIVERDGKKIGRVRPSSVEPSQTIAEIELNSLAEGVRIEPGDRVILASPAAN